MKRTKRQENSIIINFILFLVLFVSFLGIFLTYILPAYEEVEILKEETNTYYSDLQSLKKTGISFADFKDKTKAGDMKKNFGSKKDLKIDYTLGIIDSVNKNFYDKFFQNTEGGTYEDFLSKIQNVKQKTKDTEEQLKVLGKILPSYSESIYELEGENSLTDFKFINYLESIFSAFNLSYKNSIGIKNLTILPDYVIGVGDSSLDKNIFYIPLEFDIEGSKLSIINFLHFVENVGKISIEEVGDEEGESEEDKENKENKEVVVNASGKLKIYNETYERGDYFYNFRNIKLSNNKKDTNIFDNQIFSIESISFNEYINSSLEPNVSGRKNLSFLNFLKSTKQLPERFTAKIQLRFYVKGQPKYKIEKFINDFKKKFQQTKTDITKMLSTGDFNSSDSQKLKNIKNTIDSLTNSVKNLKSKSKDKNLTDIYNEAYKYNKFLDSEILKINKIKEKIGNTEKSSKD